jgi:hypothetical protein
VFRWKALGVESSNPVTSDVIFTELQASAKRLTLLETVDYCKVRDEILKIYKHKLKEEHKEDVKMTIIALALIFSVLIAFIVFFGLRYRGKIKFKTKHCELSVEPESRVESIEKKGTT